MEQDKDKYLFKATDYLVSGQKFAVFWDEERQRAYTFEGDIEPHRDYYTSPAYDSHKNKAKGFVSFLYAKVQRVMFSIKYSALAQQGVLDGPVLDIGAGVGAFASYLKDKGHRVAVVEKHSKARKSCEAKGLQAYETIEELPENAQFNSITLWHVLEHLAAPERVLSEIQKRLKPGGLLIIAVPNFKSHDAQYYKSHWAALDVPRHLWHFTPQGLIRLVTQTHFSFLKTKPLWFDVFYVAYLTEKHLKKRFPLLRGLFKGAVFFVFSLWTGKHSSLMFLFKK